MLALENTTMDKVALCQAHGLTISPEQWPSHHLPQKILADRGELEGYNADQLVNGLGITVANTPPYRADWKGIVERYFRLSNERVIHWLPGAVQPDPQRGDPDYRLDACLTLDEFRQIMIHCILEHNNGYRMDWYDLDQAMIADQVEPYPVELWAWGIKNRVGHLRTAATDLIRLNLLPQGEASIARDGLHFQGLRYDCELGRREDWFVRARAYGRERVTVAYDPRLVDVIYLRLADQQRLEPCYLLDKHRAYRGRDWYDILDYLALAKQQHQAARSHQLQVEAAHEAQIDQIVIRARERQTAMLETAASQTDAGKLSKAARLKDIQQNRQEERLYEQEQDQWQLIPAEEAADNQPESCPLSGYVPPPSQIDLLHQVRQHKLNGENSYEN
ncbi:MAG: Mu transposase C-terminal domain-containing protein [Chloroflexota bacterium]